MPCHPPEQWRLTPTETDVMDALCETGTATAVAARLGKTRNTVHEHLKNARAKIGGGTLLSALAWDRYSRKTAS